VVEAVATEQARKLRLVVLAVAVGQTNKLVVMERLIKVSLVL
jgi:hypothetical protein